MEFKNLDQTKALAALQKDKKVSVREALTTQRIAKYQSPEAGGLLSYHYAAMPVDEQILGDLQRLSDEQELIAKYKALLGGEVMNTGEKRLVLHQLSRGQVLPTPVIADGEDKGKFYKGQLERIKEFSEQVRSGKLVGSTGKSFTTVC